MGVWAAKAQGLYSAASDLHSLKNPGCAAEKVGKCHIIIKKNVLACKCRRHNTKTLQFVKQSSIFNFYFYTHNANDQCEGSKCT